jgi:tetratricopeptide (TPR) repeat protein
MVRLQGNLRKDPGDLASQLALGRLYANGGKRDEAKRCFEAIFKADAALQRAESAEACLEMGLLLRRAYEYTKALEFFAKARVTALARAEAAAKAENAAAKKPDGPAPLAKPEVELLDKVLYELAATQILAKKKDALRATLDEYDRKVSTPDSRRHAWVLLKLGQACLEAGDDAKAREAWKRCDSLYSRSPEARECREAQALRNPGNQKE